MRVNDIIAVKFAVLALLSKAGKTASLQMAA
jgi:hypothetical protein